jgi:signal peptidase
MLQVDAGPFALPPTQVGERAGRPVDGRSRWMQRVSTGILTLAMVLAVVVGVAAAMGVRAEVVLTGSMRPALSPNDMIVVDRVAASDTHVGDIVSFASPTQPGIVMTHRVKRIAQTKQGRLAITTQGDANNTPEHWTIAPDGTVGRVVTVLPPLGALTQWVGDPVTRTIVFALIGLMLMVGGLRWIWRSD